MCRFSSCSLVLACQPAQAEFRQSPVTPTGHSGVLKALYNMLRFLSAACIALAGATTGTQVLAQGYVVQPWPAGKPTPELAGLDLNGRAWHLGDLRGKGVLVNFWASWCPPCLAEMPSLQALAQFYGPEKLVVLTVNFKESAAVAQRFAQRADLGLPVLLDPSGALARQWGATVFPTSVLVAADGKVRSVVRGEVDWSGLPAAKLVEPLWPTGPTSTSKP